MICVFAYSGLGIQNTEHQKDSFCFVLCRFLHIFLYSYLFVHFPFRSTFRIQMIPIVWNRFYLDFDVTIYMHHTWNKEKNSERKKWNKRKQNRNSMVRFPFPKFQVVIDMDLLVYFQIISNLLSIFGVLLFGYTTYVHQNHPIRFSNMFMGLSDTWNRWQQSVY